MEKHKCEGQTWDGWRHHPCSNNATTKVSGKNYCGIHNPDKIKERDEKRDVKYERERRERMYKHYAEAYCKKRNLTFEQLKEDEE